MLTMATPCGFIAQLPLIATPLLRMMPPAITQIRSHTTYRRAKIRGSVKTAIQNNLLPTPLPSMRGGHGPRAADCRADDGTAPPPTSSTLPGATAPLARRAAELDASVQAERARQHGVAAERELMLRILAAKPTKREATQFLARYRPPVPAPATTAAAVEDETATVAGIETETAPRTPYATGVGFVVLDGSTADHDLVKVGATLARLTRLGMRPVVFVEHPDASAATPATPAKDPMAAAAHGKTPPQYGQPAIAAMRAEATADRSEYAQSIQATFWVAECLDRVGAACQPVYGSGDAIWRSMAAVHGLGQIPVVAPQPAVDAATGARRVDPARGRLVWQTPLERIQAYRAQFPFQLDQPPAVFLMSRDGALRCDQGSPLRFVNLTQWRRTGEAALTAPPRRAKHLSAAAAASRTFAHAGALLDYLGPYASVVACTPHDAEAILNYVILRRPLADDKWMAAPTLSAANRGATLPTRLYTVIQLGLEMTTHTSLATVDLAKLTHCMETSFRKPLDAPAFYARLAPVLDCVLVAGDYYGFAIVTRERAQASSSASAPASTEGHEDEGIAYLDKFAVAPQNQGMGIADILWSGLRARYRDLAWRSNARNPVNKWYFTRSMGNVRSGDGHWMVFFYGEPGNVALDGMRSVCESIPQSFKRMKSIKDS
ncbi:hypothetical protein CXG81DRAFT_27493 [Caulochytrium protostelioides]|uniref:Amino-acid acetyltransferase, mitochondrial n=1 Tax=Caulochytrium protostelioides TaxID=1555241 RepID=A0A4P9X3Y1_9FUNG|nr:hypothetical protein CXG81DRAFT_27493 [Caulochytrium protostelioides]|eukprot:RKO99755.1 hypothetical protein CXG81DRAFT_27493 [Caulochytrium protostelioides]